MIVFIVPLKSAQVSKSWTRVSKLFERTLKSLCQQTSPDFRVIVACHERPNINFNHPHAIYVEVDFPIPVWNPTGNPQKDYADLRRDKSRKIWKALVHAAAYNPSHVMFVDADDCISNKIAEFVSQNYHAPGWFVARGYEYQEGSKKVFYRKENFYQKCGSSHIVNYELISPESIKYEDIDYQYMRHSQLKKQLEEQGKYLEPLPFAGTVYMTENQENIWTQKKYILSRISPKDKLLLYARSAYKLFTSQPLTDVIRAEFGIYPLK